MLKNVLAFVISVVCVAAIAMEKKDDYIWISHERYNSYKGTFLNTNTIVDLAVKKGLILKDKAVSDWFARNYALVKTLANQMVYGDLTNSVHNITIGNVLLQQAGYHNTSSHNFVFAIQVGDTHKKYWVKIAGPNRFEQINGSLCRPWGTPVTQEDHEKLGEVQTKTYQTISRLARYLLYKEWKKQYPEIKIEVPVTYITFLSDDPLIDDAHCVVIEEHVDATKTPATHPKMFLDMRDEVRNFIIELCLWNINPRQFLIKDDETIVYLDLEDPDNSNPHNFFNADYEKVKHNIRVGLQEFDKMCKELDATVQ